jgi:hypothetical protein
MVAPLGLGIIGASHSGKDQHADGVTLSAALTRQFETKFR